MKVAKDMDSVFSDCTSKELDFDTIFDEDDCLIDIVAGVNENGEFITGEYDLDLFDEGCDDPIQDCDDDDERAGKINHKDYFEGTEDEDLEVGGEVGDGKEVSGKENSAESRAYDEAFVEEINEMVEDLNRTCYYLEYCLLEGEDGEGIIAKIVNACKTLKDKIVGVFKKTNDEGAKGKLKDINNKTNNLIDGLNNGSIDAQKGTGLFKSLSNMFSSVSKTVLTGVGLGAGVAITGKTINDVRSGKAKENLDKVGDAAKNALGNAARKTAGVMANRLDKRANKLDKRGETEYANDYRNAVKKFRGLSNGEVVESYFDNDNLDLFSEDYDYLYETEVENIADIEIDEDDFDDELIDMVDDDSAIEDALDDLDESFDFNNINLFDI